LSQTATELRSAVQGDCHSHSDWSDGGSPVRVMGEAAASLGHAYLAMTDHSPRLTVANGLDAERLRRQLELVDQLNAPAPRSATLPPSCSAWQSARAAT
jgi:putative hydrolase